MAKISDILNRIFFILSLVVFHGEIYGQIAPDVVLTTGHNDQINALSITDDSRFLASAGNNKLIKIWDVKTTREFRTISGTNGRIIELDFSPDNKHLAGLCSSDELYVWNVITGELRLRIPASSSAKGLSFSEDGQDLYFTTANSAMGIVNLESKQIVEVPETYVTAFVADRKRAVSYVMDHLGNLLKIDLKQKLIVETYQVFDELNFPFSGGDINNDGSLVAFGFVDDHVRIFDTEKGEFVYKSGKYPNKIVNVQFDLKEPYLYIASNNVPTEIVDYENKKKIADIPNTMFSVNCIEKDPRGGTIILANMTDIRFYDSKSGNVFKHLKNRIQKVVNMSYDQQNKYLAVATDKITIDLWDLQKNKVVRSLRAFFPCKFSPDGKYLIAMNGMLNLGIFETETGNQVGELKTDSELIQTLAFSNDGNYVGGAGYMNIVKVWDFNSKERVANLNGHTGGILGLDFHPTEPWIASGSHDGTSRVWDFKTKKEIQKFEDQTITIQSVKFSPNGKSLATASWDKTIKIRNCQDWSVQHTLEGHVNAIYKIDYNKDGSMLASVAGNNSVWESDNSLIVWDSKTGQQKCQIKAHDAAVNNVIFDLDANRIFTGSEDGTIKYNDPEKCEVIATFVAIDNNEFMVYTPDNYYMASKNALKGIAFRVGDQLMPFEQFDIYLNRPDIVVQRIGKAPEKIIRAYNYLYKKRLKRSGLEEGSLQLNFKLPKILIETQPELITNNSSQKIWVKAWDDEFNLKQINVYVNDVPVFGESGFEIIESVKSYRKEFEIILVDGLNKIQFSSVNSAGTESFYETVEIFREDDGQKNNLYIAAIGVSQYENSDFNLTYPTKDVQDFVQKMREGSAIYNEIKVKLLLNEEATVENFLKLDEFFAPCEPGDIAILFIAGHGVLDENFDYYYGTYDMNFNDPKEKGLEYDKIHGILGRIKAYKKLLIMDTCHSGELDKDEIEEGPAPEVEDGNIDFRAAGIGVRNKEGFGNENSVGLLQDVFSDTRKGSGATVIASAGGAEYAMESDTWKNGLFTYCFLNGLNSAETDLNKNNLIEVSEIRAFVNKKVNELSGGKQIPSSREENISQDYAIFVVNE